jgi:hypothetical protein
MSVIPIEGGAATTNFLHGFFYVTTWLRNGTRPKPQPWAQRFFSSLKAVRKVRHAPSVRHWEKFNGAPLRH